MLFWELFKVLVTVRTHFCSIDGRCCLGRVLLEVLVRNQWHVFEYLGLLAVFFSFLAGGVKFMCQKCPAGSTKKMR